MRTIVLPRDIKPGDKIDRVDLDMQMVLGTVREVQKIRQHERTVYKVFLTEHDDLPDNRKSWAVNRHLVPFLLYPTSKVMVER